jgi:hypothetical protein
MPPTRPQPFDNRLQVIHLERLAAQPQFVGHGSGRFRSNECAGIRPGACRARGVGRGGQRIGKLSRLYLDWAAPAPYRSPRARATCRRHAATRLHHRHLRQATRSPGTVGMPPRCRPLSVTMAGRVLARPMASSAVVMVIGPGNSVIRCTARAGAAARHLTPTSLVSFRASPASPRMSVLVVDRLSDARGDLLRGANGRGC